MSKSKSFGLPWMITNGQMGSLILKGFKVFLFLLHIYSFLHSFARSAQFLFLFLVAEAAQQRAAGTEHQNSGTAAQQQNRITAAQGGFGMVYKGQLTTSAATRSTKPATTVAIKRLDIKGGQGQHEFLMEIFMLSSYKHDNLVSLIGFSEEGDEKLIVYEHEVRGSLDKYLTTDLTWVQRLQICLGAARGLNYLHNGVGEGHRVLHRDIKSSNILLDEDWEAKISDFGLSKIGPTNQEFTFLVTNAAGTFGYVDPLYVTTGVLTKESDVYSFGVVLFEVLCGRVAMIGKYDDERRFLSHLAKVRYEEGKLDEIILPNLRRQIKQKSFQTFSKIAYQCLNIDRKQRPTMASIMEQLQVSLEFQIGCRRITRIGLWGSSTGGSPWSLQLDCHQKLRKITIDHEDWVYSIGFTTQDFSGSLDSSQHHGGAGGQSGGRISEINFDNRGTWNSWSNHGELCRFYSNLVLVFYDK